VLTAAVTPSFSPPLPLPDPTLVVDPTVVSAQTTLTVDPVTGAVIQTTSTSASSSVASDAAAAQPVVDPVTGATLATPTGTATSTTGDAIAIALVTTVYINVANSVIQKPVDQIIITDKPRAQSLVCR
jgi:hypothetical protein